MSTYNDWLNRPLFNTLHEELDRLREKCETREEMRRALSNDLVILRMTSSVPRQPSFSLTPFAQQYNSMMAPLRGILAPVTCFQPIPAPFAEPHVDHDLPYFQPSPSLPAAGGPRLFHGSLAVIVPYVTKFAINLQRLRIICYGDRNSKKKMTMTLPTVPVTNLAITLPWL